MIPLNQIHKCARVMMMTTPRFSLPQKPQPLPNSLFYVYRYRCELSL